MSDERVYNTDMPPSYVDVWVTEHDDPDVRWVVNTRDDMLSNYADLLVDTGVFVSFEEYLDTWTHLRMPDWVFGSGHEASWVFDQFR